MVKKEKLEKKSAAARSNMKANSVQGQPSMEDFRWAKPTKTDLNQLYIELHLQSE